MSDILGGMVFPAVTLPGPATLADLDALPATARIMILDALVRLGGEDARAWCRGVLGRRGWFEPREVKERQAELVQVLKAVKNDLARELTAEAGR